MRKAFVIVLFSLLLVILGNPALAQNPGYRYEYENQYDEEGNIISTTKRSVKIEQVGGTDVLDEDGNVIGTVIEKPGGTFTVVGSSAMFIVERVYDDEPHARPNLSNYRVQTTNHKTVLYSLSSDYDEAISILYEYSRLDFSASYNYTNRPFIDQDYFTFSDGSVPNYIIDGNSLPSFKRSLWLNLF